VILRSTLALVGVAAVLSGVPDAAPRRQTIAPPVLLTGPLVILNGDFPDPTIVRDGNDYYLTHSAFDYVPGLLIWHSVDLRNWKPIARALSRRVGTIWAPDLVKHNDLFYIYFPANRTNYVITARTPYGPWSDPLDLKIDGIDPGHLAAPDGTRYLYVSEGRAVELSPDGLSVKGTLQKVYDGWRYPDDWAVECFCLDSPKLFYRNGYYYLTSAQGGTAGPSTSHMAVSARSKDPMGPWKNSPRNPIIRTWSGAEPWWSKGHATLVSSGRGEWFAVYHAYQNRRRNFGRQTLIEPIVWTPDGWFTTAPSAVPTGSPQIARNHRIESDDFASSSLKLQWQFSGIASTEEFAIADGTLTFTAHPDTVKVLHTQSGDYDYEATVAIEAEAGVEAGLVAYYGPEMYAGIATRGGRLHSVSKARLEGRGAECAGCHYLKIQVVDDNLSTFASTDGVEWKKQPTSVDVSWFQTNVLGGFSSVRIGIYGKGNGRVKVRRFTYRPLQRASGG
jgi:xylan 1,4-beta-xylosidase